MVCCSSWMDGGARLWIRPAKIPLLPFDFLAPQSCGLPWPLPASASLRSGRTVRASYLRVGPIKRKTAGPARGRAGCFGTYFLRAAFLAAGFFADLTLAFLLAVDLLTALAAFFTAAFLAVFLGAAFFAVFLLLTFFAAFLATFFALPATFFAAFFTAFF